MDESRLTELLDRQALHDLAARYCRAVSRCDAELLRSVYHPDARDDHGIFDGNAWEFVGFIIPLLREKLHMTQIVIGAETIEIRGDKARGEIQYVGYETFRGEDTPLLTVGGRYLDRYERRDGEWRIVERVNVQDWRRVDPAREEFLSRIPPMPHPVHRGTQDRDDPSYAWFQGDL